MTIHLMTRLWRPFRRRRRRRNGQIIVTLKSAPLN